MKGVLSSALPSTVVIDSLSVPIRTDWRVWVDVWRILDNVQADDAKRAVAILALAYAGADTEDREQPFYYASKHANEALEAALNFLKRKRDNVPERPKTFRERKLQKKHLLDWDFDAGRVIADFEREYSIDLTAPDCSMHWWRFMALFNGLSDGSQTMEAVRTRAADLSNRKISKEERQALREKKLAYMLPARTKEEAAENRKLRGE